MGGPAQGNGRPGKNASALEKLRSFAEKRQDQARNFSKVAPSTQHREDRIVGEYKAWVKEVKTEMKEIDSNVTSTELDAHCFPPSSNGSFNSLYELLAGFLDYTASNLAPRSSSDGKPSFRSLKSYTDTLSKTIRQIYEAKARNTNRHDIPDRGELRTELVNVSSFLVRDYDFELTPGQKTVHMGKAEIAFLLDFDLRGTKSIELAECHHLAWTLGFLCGLRPGSLGPCNPGLQDSKIKHPYLTFRDCVIYRESDDGAFTLVLTIRNLKTDSAGHIVRMDDNKKLAFKIKAPRKVRDLALSPALRILVIALRRNALRDYTSIDALLGGTSINIRFKEEFLDKPVLLKSTEGGLGITEQPATAKSFSSYLAPRARHAGFLEDVSFYSFRHATASRWIRDFGWDEAQLLMGHAVRQTLGKSYADTVSTSNVTWSAFETDHSQDDSIIIENALLWERISSTRLEEMYQQDVPRQIELDYDHDAAQRLDSKSKKAYDKEVRNNAVKTVMRNLKQSTLDDLQMDVVKARKEEILSGLTAFNKRLFELADQPNSTVDRDASFPDQLEQVQYGVATATVLDMLLNNALARRTFYEAGPCPLCQEDPTISQADKDKVWEIAKLRRHIEGSDDRKSWVHSAKKKFERLCFQKRLPNGRLQCPYCVTIAPAGAEVADFGGQGELNAHVKKSGPNHISGAMHRINGRQPWGTRALAREHDRLKEAEGWNSPDFEYGPYANPELRPTQIHTFMELDDSSDDSEDDSVQFDKSKTTQSFRRLTDSNILPDRELVASQTDLRTRSTTIDPEIVEISDSDEQQGAYVDKTLATDTSLGEVVIEDSEEERLEVASSTDVLTRPARGGGTGSNTSKNSSQAQQPQKLPGTRMAKIVGLSHGRMGRSSDDASAPALRSTPLVTDKPQSDMMSKTTSVSKLKPSTPSAPKPSSKPSSKAASKAATKHASKSLAKAASRGSSKPPAEATSESSFKPHKFDDGRNRNLHDFFKPTQSFAVPATHPEISEYPESEDDFDEDVRAAKRRRRSVSL